MILRKVEKMEEEEAQEVELEEAENETKSLDNPRSSKQLRKHRIVRDFDNEAVIEGKFGLAEHMYEDLRKEAFERRVTMGYLVREALDRYLSQLKEEAEEEAETEAHPKLREAINLVTSCDKTNVLGLGAGFEIAGENGFIEKLEASDLDPVVWENDDLLKALAERLAIGYNQWFDAPDGNELLKRISSAMGISKEKRVLFRKAFSSALGSEIEA